MWRQIRQLEHPHPARSGRSATALGVAASDWVRSFDFAICLLHSGR